MKLQWHVIGAVFWRNFVSYFSNPIGYLFITAFVWAGAYFAFWHNDTFFTHNIADLDQLNQYFPYLLLFFVPAITMTVWAEERRSGTEELLLTLPASDLEIVLGKYLSCLAIYTVSLLFSMSHIAVLVYLGNPDRGLMVSTYFGYWLLGAALLSAGMVASLLTANVTIAFILGSFFCLILVSFHHIGTAAGVFREWFSNGGVVPHFEPFGSGLVSAHNVFYFASIIVVMLYLNMVLLSRRHWGGSVSAPEHWMHYLTRAVSIAVAAVSLTILAGRVEARLSVDVTQERLHELSPETISMVRSLDPARPVLIEAFVSPADSVPADYVETRKNLIDVLRRIDALGGNAIVLNLHEDVAIYTEEARMAERVYGIRPEMIPSFKDGRFSGVNTILGIACKSGLNQTTVPFVYRGLPIEYELARMIRTVTDSGKRKVGVLGTDASLFGSFNMQMMQPGRDWLIIDELKQQYDVVQVTADAPITTAVDVLIVPMLSSLTQPQMDNLALYIREGKPTLLFDDPLPVSNPGLAAKAPKQPPQQNPMMMQMQPPTENKGDLNGFLRMLNVEFDADMVVWQAWNPHPQYQDLPAEFLFIGAGSGNPDAFNPAESATAGLQELIVLYGGSLRPGPAASPKFVPLLTTGTETGVTRWDDLLQMGPFGIQQLNRDPLRKVTNRPYTIAARITGPLADAAAGPAAADAAPAAVNVIMVADLDLMSDQFFELRRQGQANLVFDNVGFVLNCVDVLAGDESFVQLRKKRPRRRNLDTIAELTREREAQARGSEEQATLEARSALDAAQAELDRKVEKIRARTDISEREKAVLIANTQAAEQRRFDKTKDEIEREKQEKVRGIQDDLQTAIRQEQDRIKWLAVLIPPIPALLLGIAVFLGRVTSEREGVNPKRMIS